MQIPEWELRPPSPFTEDSVLHLRRLPSPSTQLEIQLKDELRRAAHRKFQTQQHLVKYNKAFKKYVEITVSSSVRVTKISR